MTPNIDLKIIPATMADKEMIFHYLVKNFFPEEPLAKALKSNYKTVEEFPLLDVLSDGLSFKAIDASDQSEDNLVGLAVNSIRKPEQFNHEEVKESDHRTGLRKILKLLEFLEKEADFWNRVQVDRAFEVLILSVKPNCRGLNIGKKLMEKSLEYGKSLGYKYSTIECSSIYSARISANLGYEVFSEVKYDDYRDENNEIIFKSDPPHKSIILYVKKL